MSRWAEADWEPVVNYTPGAQAGGQIRYLFLHHSVGPLSAAYARFNIRSSSASAHFGNPLGDGRMVQWVDDDDVAWAQMNGNWIRAVSVETESYADDWRLFTPMDDGQLTRVARLAAHLHVTRDFPLQVSDDPSVPGLVYHSMNPPSWGITGCPGQPIVDQRPEVIRRALGGTPDTPSIPTREVDAMILQGPTRAGTTECWLVVGGFMMWRFTGAIDQTGYPWDATAYSAGVIPMRHAEPGWLDTLYDITQAAKNPAGTVDPAQVKVAVDAALANHPALVAQVDVDTLAEAVAVNLARRLAA